MVKCYRAKKDSFMWKKGAILIEENGYRPISDLWDMTEKNGTEYISSGIIENSPEWFERVYEISILGKMKYAIKEVAQKKYAEVYESDETE